MFLSVYSPNFVYNPVILFPVCLMKTALQRLVVLLGP
jgi:hypothetical protein